jgi:hypothetical protein
VNVKIYVEGGGETRAIQAPLRRAFTNLLKNAGFAGRMPSIVGCGGRTEAFEVFVNRVSNPEPDTTYLLLVDSEDTVKSAPWTHLQTRVGDGWQRPENAIDEQVHFMATCMETWLIADIENLKNYFGKGFNEKALLASNNTENRARDKQKEILENASKDCKTKFIKGVVSFEILENTSPEKLRSLSYFQRFTDELEKLKPRSK